MLNSDFFDKRQIHFTNQIQRAQSLKVDEYWNNLVLGVLFVCKESRVASIHIPPRPDTFRDHAKDPVEGSRDKKY